MKAITIENVWKITYQVLDHLFSFGEYERLESVECSQILACSHGYAWKISNCIYVDRSEYPGCPDYVINYTTYDNEINVYQVLEEDGICYGYKYYGSVDTHSNQINFCCRLFQLLTELY